MKVSQKQALRHSLADVYSPPVLRTCSTRTLVGLAWPVDKMRFIFFMLNSRGVLVGGPGTEGAGSDSKTHLKSRICLQATLKKGRGCCYNLWFTSEGAGLAVQKTGF